jgi:hypothetical protein
MLTDAAQRKLANQVIDAVADPDVQSLGLRYVGMYTAHNLRSQEHLERLDVLLDSVEHVFVTEGSTILGTVPLSPGRLVGARSADPLEKAGLQLARIASDVRITRDDLMAVARLVVAMAPTQEIVEGLREVHQDIHAVLAGLDRPW